jgi:hypothetical protein
MSRETLAKTENFSVAIEETGGFFIVHCSVYNWSKVTLKELYSVMDTVIAIAEGHGYDTIDTMTPSPRFAELFNFEMEDLVVEVDGEYQFHYRYYIGE